MAHSLGMAYSISNCYWSSLRDAHQGKAIDTGCSDNCLQVLHPLLKRHFFYVSLRETIAAFVVANQPMMFRQLSEPMLPEWAVPFVIEMIEPVGCLDQRISRTSRCVGQPDAIVRYTKLNILPRHATLRMRGVGLK